MRAAAAAAATTAGVNNARSLARLQTCVRASSPGRADQTAVGHEGTVIL